MEKLVHKVLNSLVPNEDREKISAYWERFKVKPDIRIVDASSGVKSAAVGSLLSDWPILYVFYFRSYLAKAPEEIKITIIKHELIHVLLDCDLTPEKIFRRKLLQPQNTLISDFDAALSAITRARRIDFEEGCVGQINDLWGSDQKAASDWISENEE